MPFAFTEHGVLQLANVLKSKRARKMSIRIIEVFVKMRELLFSQIELLHKIEKLEKKEKNILWYGIGVLILIGGLTMVVRTKK